MVVVSRSSFRREDSAGSGAAVVVGAEAAVGVAEEVAGSAASAVAADLGAVVEGRAGDCTIDTEP